MTMTSSNISALVRLVAATFSLVLAQHAFAHAHPTRETPAANATVAASQADVTIDFDNGIEPAFSSIAVTDAQGHAATRGKSSVDANDARRMTVPLATLAPGAYTVAWVAVATDGHRTQGHYSFTVK